MRTAKQQEKSDQKVMLSLLSDRDRLLNHSTLVSVAELLEIATRLQQTDRYLNLHETCALTGFSKRSIQKAKDLPRYRPLDGSIRFRLSEIHAWMKRHSEQIESEKQDAFLKKIRQSIGAKI